METADITGWFRVYRSQHPEVTFLEALDLLLVAHPEAAKQSVGVVAQCFGLAAPTHSRAGAE